MPRIFQPQGRWRNIVAAAPNLDLRLAMLFDRLRLVEPLQGSVVAFVEAPASLHRNPHPIGGVQNQPQRADSAFQHRGEGDLGLELFALQFAPRLLRLLESLIAQVDVVPAGEQVLDVPNALSVTDQDQFSGHSTSYRRMAAANTPSKWVARVWP